MFTRDVTMLRADRKSRADRKIRQVEILGDAPHHKPGTLPIIQPLTEEAMKNRAASVKSL